MREAVRLASAGVHGLASHWAVEPAQSRSEVVSELAADRRPRAAFEDISD